MSLVNLMRNMTISSPFTSFVSRLLIPKVEVTNTSSVRSYIGNFFNDKTAIKPKLGWMHQNRPKGPGNKHKKMRLTIRNYSELKRQKCFSYEARMNTEGGRKLIMRRILMGRDHLSG